jgi:putative acetyltransferase
MRIVVDDLSGPAIAAFLMEHIWSVLDGDTVVGCGAMKRLDASHAELKSMRTARARKRSGIASMLLEHIIAEATRAGFTRLSLETGSADFFRPARSLYEKYGFDYCEPFADYKLDPHSAFMTRTLIA